MAVKLFRVQLPTHTGVPADADAWPITGTTEWIVTRIDGYSGYRLTHAASGMFLPSYGVTGSDFRSIRATRDACRRMLVLCPDAAEIGARVAAHVASRQDSDRLRAAWRAANGVPSPADVGTLRDMITDVLPDGWDGDEDTLTCPHGHVIEHDGRCPSGCVSPLIAAGLV